MKKRIGWKELLLAMGLFYSALHLGYSVRRYNPIVNPAGFSSMHELYTWSLQFKNTGELPSESQFGWIPPVYHPPFCYLLFGFLTRFDFQAMATFLYLTQFILFPLAIVLLVRATVPREAPTLLEYAMAAILTINFQPFLDTFSQYKIEGLEFVLICLAIAAFQKKRDLLCGLILAVAANLKYLPAILLFYFLVKREARVLKGAAISLGVILLILLAALGLEPVWRYGLLHSRDLLFSSHPSSNMRMAQIAWQSLSGAIHRLFATFEPPLTLGEFLRTGALEWAAISHPRLAYALGMGLKILLGAGYLFFLRTLWKRFERKSVWNSYLLEISLTLVMLVVLIQAMRPNYGILILPAFLMVGLLLIHQWRRFHLKEKVLFWVAYALSGMIIPGGLLDRLPEVPLWGREHARAYLWWSLPFYGYLILGICILLCAQRILKAKGE